MTGEPKNAPPPVLLSSAANASTKAETVGSALENRPQNAPKRLSTVHRGFERWSEIIEGKRLTWWALLDSNQ